jgi:O-antigen/teichoic acid export membrane protein
VIKVFKSAISRWCTAVRGDDLLEPPPACDEARGGEGRGGETLRRVARGSITALFIYSAGVGLTYFSQLVIARILGVDTYGVYAYVFAWIVVLAYFSALGFDVALLRFVPAYEVQGAGPLLKGVIQYAQRRVLAVGLAIIFVGAIVVMTWASAPEIRNAFLVGFGLVPILALIRIRCAVVRALGGVISALAPDRMVRDGLLIGLLGIAILGLGWTIDASLVMLATLISAAAGLGSTVFALRRHRLSAMDDVLPEYDTATWRQAAFPLVVAGATEVLMNRTGVMLLGWFATTKDAGIYSLAFNIALVVTLPRVAVNTLFAPAISKLYTRNDKAMMQILVSKTALWTLCSGLGIAVVLFVIANPFLAWFGPGYQAGGVTLRILLISQAIAAGGGAQLYVMTMTGHENSAAGLLVSIAIANAIMTATLIIPFGLIGAAVAAGATLVIWNAAMALFLWRRLQLVPGVLAIFRLPIVNTP